MKPDPARTELLQVLDALDQRVESATNGIIRGMCGGAGWNCDQVRRYRAELARVVADLDAVTRALTALDQLDAECGDLP